MNVHLADFSSVVGCLTSPSVMSFEAVQCGSIYGTRVSVAPHFWHPSLAFSNALATERTQKLTFLTGHHRCGLAPSISCDHLAMFIFWASLVRILYSMLSFSWKEILRRCNFRRVVNCTFTPKPSVYLFPDEQRPSLRVRYCSFHFPFS